MVHGAAAVFVTVDVVDVVVVIVGFVNVTLTMYTS